MDTEKERQMSVRPAQAARMLGISTRQVSRLIAEEKIRSVRVGSMRLIPIEALAEFLAGKS